MDHNTPERAFNVIAQVNWELRFNGVPNSHVVTSEELHLKVKPTKGAFMAALRSSVKNGAQVPGPGEGCKAIPLSVYGSLNWKQVIGPALDEDGEVLTPVGDETE